MMEDLISKQEVLDWVIEYHKRSFELHGRYFPSEVIGWLLNDIAKHLLYKENNDE